MKQSRRFSFSSSPSSTTTTTVTYTFRNDQTAPSSTPTPTPTVIVQSSAAAAAKIQSAYRAHLIRGLYRTISAADAEAGELQRLIQRQDTVDAVRSDERERLRMNEALMALLLKLDSVPGRDPAVRDARRKVSRRIVGLQEILDSVSEAKIEHCGEYFWGSGDGLMRNWDEVVAEMEETEETDEVVAEMEEQVCRDRGGDDLERFCDNYLGFRCLRRFLREP